MQLGAAGTAKYLVEIRAVHQAWGVPLARGGRSFNGMLIIAGSADSSLICLKSGLQGRRYCVDIANDIAACERRGGVWAVPI